MAVEAGGVWILRSRCDRLSRREFVARQRISRQKLSSADFTACHARDPARVAGWKVVEQQLGACDFSARRVSHFRIHVVRRVGRRGKETPRCRGYYILARFSPRVGIPNRRARRACRTSRPTLSAVFCIAGALTDD